jgi:hypothetical protein
MNNIAKGILGDVVMGLESGSRMLSFHFIFPLMPSSAHAKIGHNNLIIHIGLFIHVYGIIYTHSCTKM